MSHVGRLRVSERIFFITVNLRRRIPSLEPVERDLVAQAIQEARATLGFQLCGYVVMPDHWHALLWPRHPLTISRVVQDIKWTSARSINRRRKSFGSVWQHQFWDRFVRTAREFHERLDYMHQNPVRKGLVERPGDWAWSSYNNFATNLAGAKLSCVEVDYIRLPAEYRG